MRCRNWVLAVSSVVAALAIVVPSAPAAPVTQARFLHAVAGAPPAVLVVRGHPPQLPSSYGKPSAYHACSPGPARLVLKVKGQSKPAANKRIELGRGRYTVIAVPEGDRVDLRVYKDDGAVTPGMARVRAIHAAAEIDQADVRVDGRVVAPALNPGAATKYASFEPGRHDLSITRPGGRGGPLLAEDGVPLVAGTASTAIVVGSRGMPTEFLFVSDGAAGPSTAPATGFVGEVGEDTDWLLVISASLLAGSLGGAAYLLTARGGRRTLLVAGPEPLGALEVPIPEAPEEAPPEVYEEIRDEDPDPRALDRAECLRPEIDPHAAAPSEPLVPAEWAFAFDPATVSPEPVVIRRERGASPEPAVRRGDSRDRARIVSMAAVVTAGSLGRLLYRARRRRRGR